MRVREKIQRFVAVCVCAVICVSGCQGQKETVVTETATVVETTQKTGETETTQTQDQTSQSQATTASESLILTDFPKMDGSTATLPLAYALYQQVTGSSLEQAKEAIVHSKTDSSYYRLADKEVDILLAYEPSDSVFRHGLKNTPVDMKPIGRDALVFLANEGNPVTSLTEEQLVSIYSGATDNWSAVAGRDQEIMAFVRPYGSGSQTLMEKLVMKGTPMAYGPTYKTASDMEGLVDVVASYHNSQNALGYSVYFYAQYMYDTPGLRFMAVDGVMPSNQTISDGTYPYINEFYAVIRRDEPEDSDARRLFDWLTQEDGQQLIAKTGYVPVMDLPMDGGDTTFFSQGQQEGRVELPITEDQRIVIGGYDVRPMFLDQNGKQSELSENRFVQTNRASLISVDQPLLVQDIQTGDMGLFSMRDQTWVKPPVKGYVAQKENGLYRVSVSNQNTEDRWYDSDFNPIYQGDAQCVGDRLWAFQDQNQCQIMDQNGQLIKTLDMDMQERYFSDFFSSQDYMMFAQNNDLFLYDQDGKLVFDSRVVGSDVVHTGGPFGGVHGIIYGWAKEGGWSFDCNRQKVLFSGKKYLRGMWVGEKLLLMGRDESPFTADYDPIQGVLTVVREDDKRKPAGDGWFATMETQGQNQYLVMENEKQQTSYRLPVDSVYGTSFYPIHLVADYFVIAVKQDKESDVWDTYLLYEKEQFLYAGLSVQTDSATITLQPDTYRSQEAGYPIVLDLQGNKRYQGPAGEEILLVEQNFLVTQRGNYIYILDGDGKVLYSHISLWMREE